MDALHDPHWGVDVAMVLSQEKDPIDMLDQKLEIIACKIDKLAEYLDSGTMSDEDRAP